MTRWAWLPAVLSWALAVQQSRKWAVEIPRATPVEHDRLGDDPPLVSIIVPARNEASHLERCLRSLLAQDYPHVEIIVVDDCSTDDTPQILSRLREEQARLIVAAGAALPDGWMGKAWAIDQGYRRARGAWLLFTDADTEHAPWLLSSCIAHVLPGGASFATAVGDQRQPTLGAYLANLAVFTALYVVTDPGKVVDPASPQSLVNGQYLLFAREAYEEVGTHAALRGYSSTDAVLGYLAKLEGYRPSLVDARGALTTTMYRDFPEAYRGWSRSLVNGSWSAFGRGRGSAVLLGVTAAMAAFWLAPWGLGARAVRRRQALPALAATLQALAGTIVLHPLTERWSLALRDTLAMPVSCALFALMAVTGLAHGALRGGTVWKGRVVPTARRLPPWCPKPPRTHGRRIAAASRGD
jgi:chlorobactene glucosyltransferase